MADSTAMTVDFLRARLLSERSVSRAAKERADELAKRVAELEEQVREVTAQRRQAERATDEVLAILETQGFGGHLSDDWASDQEDDSKSRGDTARAPGEEEPSEAKGEAEDALSGTAQPGGLSWKGRSVSPHKATQLKQKHRRSYFYLLSSDSSPKYRMGQSCRKNKRRIELSNGSRSAAPPEGDGDGAGNQKRRHDGPDCTDDGQADMDDEVGGDERSSGDGGGGQYVIRCEKDGEMERVLERQAELIGQYEEEEKAQREWEKQYNENRNANKVDVDVKNKAYQTGAEAKSRDKNLPIIVNPSAESLPNGSLSESPKRASQENGAQRREASNEHELDHVRAQTSFISAQESSTTSTVTRQDQDRGDLMSDGDSGYNANTKHYAIKAPSDGSPSSDTLNSKVSDWSSSQFHDNTDNQAETTRPYRPLSINIEDIERVLQALQSARISLCARLSKPVPPSQVTLALPAPGDDHNEYDDLLANDGSSNSHKEELSSSSPPRQEILALRAPEDYHERVDLPGNGTGILVPERLSSSSPRREEILALPAPGDDYCREIQDYTNIPVGAPGLFRLPTDSFPVDEEMFSGGVSLVGNLVTAAHGAAASAPSVSGDGSAFSAKQCYDLQTSALLPVPTPGRCSIPTPDFTVGSAPFLPGIPGIEKDLSRAGHLGNADLLMHRGIDYTISNKWML
ncbi:hypothetical protein BAE44_0005374 [Dichanthelium oligosanthes]|uniref:Uncharacterized protein n=1 Tax=Dichanthelium oligosanthes TaxID=888268 RepID=A0A1E5W8A0_9POAL|nr:hypothetical protein BAE44_0005374 [Dichanthelium oligosanthes]